MAVHGLYMAKRFEFAALVCCNTQRACMHEAAALLLHLHLSHVQGACCCSQQFRASFGAAAAETSAVGRTDSAVAQS